MSDTLHEVEEKILKRLAEHERRYAEDPAYRKWFDSLESKVKSPIPGTVGL